jgi:hypothetical protein
MLLHHKKWGKRCTNFFSLLHRKQTGYFASEHDDDDTYSVSTEKEEDTAYRRSSRKRKSTLHDRK